MLLSFDDGGNYCCSKQCDDKKTIPTTIQECCKRVESKNDYITVTDNVVMDIVAPVIHWDLPDAVGLNGGAVTGSCSATANPKPNVRVLIPGCDYQLKNVYIDVHTNSAVFTINNVTKNCKKIYCLIRNNVHNIYDMKELPIIGKHQVN